MGVDLEAELVCAGFDHHRSVPGAVSVGLIPAVQGGGQDAYVVELHGNIPAFIRITDGKVHDVNILDEIMPETGAFYVMDRATSIFRGSSSLLSVRPSLSCAPRPTCCSNGATPIR
jgi:hypothetical protein